MKDEDEEFIRFLTGFTKENDKREVKYGSLEDGNILIQIQGFDKTFIPKSDEKNTEVFETLEDMYAYICEHRAKEYFTETRRNFLIGGDYFYNKSKQGKHNNTGSTNKCIGKKYGKSSRTVDNYFQLYKNIIKLSIRCGEYFANLVLDDVYPFSEGVLKNTLKSDFLENGFEEFKELLNETLSVKEEHDKTLSISQVTRCYNEIIDRLNSSIEELELPDEELKSTDSELESISLLPQITDSLEPVQSEIIEESVGEIISVLNAGAKTLYHKDSKDMSELENNSVHLLVTSPPYFNAKKYFDGLYDCLEDFIAQMKLHFLEVKRVLQPGRYAFINISDLGIKDLGYKIPLPAILTSIMLELGFKYRFKILWNKGVKQKANQKNMGNILKHKLPCHYSPNCIIEDVLVFENEGDFSPVKDKDMSTQNSNKFSLDYLKELQDSNFDTDVWGIPVKTGHNYKYTDNGKQKTIPAFPDELPKRIIELFSFKGETVLDNFAGSGTTLRVAEELGRKSIGYENIPEVFEFVKDLWNINKSKKEIIEFSTEDVKNVS